MRQVDVAIVGGGVFGQVIARELLHRGREVEIYDCHHKEGASKPSGFLMKPTWFSSLGKDIYEPALALLTRHYTVKEEQFRLLGNMKLGGVMHIQPSEILGMRVNPLKVTEIKKKCLITEKGPIAAKLIIIAAGVWSSELVPVPGLTGKAGISFVWDVKPCFTKEPFIKVWAPYKHLVCFKRTETELWVGDGSAIKQANWTDQHKERSFQRCVKAIEAGPKLAAKARPLFGVRPYIPGVKPCYLERPKPWLWVATGGAKNGTIAAAWAAHKIAEAVC